MTREIRSLKQKLIQMVDDFGHIPNHAGIMELDQTIKTLEESEAKKAKPGYCYQTMLQMTHG